MLGSLVLTTVNIQNISTIQRMATRFSREIIDLPLLGSTSSGFTTDMPVVHGSSAFTVFACGAV